MIFVETRIIRNRNRVPDNVLWIRNANTAAIEVIYWFSDRRHIVAAMENMCVRAFVCAFHQFVVCSSEKVR